MRGCKMQVEILSQTDEKIVVHLKKTSAAFANALRRAVINRLPSFAISEVDFYENNSPFYNEYLANRLGMIPITFEGNVAADAKISLTLNASGPGTVYSKDLVSSDDAIKPLNGNFPIVDLGESQNVRLEAWAVQGNALQHAKFQSAIASYTNYAKFELKKSAAAKEFLASLPKKVLDGDSVNPWYAELVEEFLEENPEQGSISYKDDEFIFFAESYNNVTAIEKLRAALETIKKETGEIKKEF